MSFTALSKQIEAASARRRQAAEAVQDARDLDEGSEADARRLQQAADSWSRRVREAPRRHERQAAAQQLLGRGYQTILPLFTEGTKSLKEQLHWADEYGVTLNKKTLEPVEKLTKAQRELKVANLGLQVAFTKATAPALLKVEQAGLKVLG
jgi:hypothetical protein